MLIRRKLDCARHKPKKNYIVHMLFVCFFGSRITFLKNEFSLMILRIATPRHSKPACAKTRAKFMCSTTAPFTIWELQHPSYKVLELHKIRWSPDREALKL